MNHPFDFTPYEFTRQDPVLAMDVPHIQMLHLAAEIAPGDVAVEVGSGNGASTSALVRAVEKGYLRTLHIIEPRMNESLSRVLGNGHGISWSQEPYWNTPTLKASLVFIDGDHQWPALADLATALSRDVDVICMHDTRASDDYTWGSETAAKILRQATGRVTFEDDRSRDGMATHRGFLVSAKDGIDLGPLFNYRNRFDEHLGLHP